jgi:hypothetical protein
MNNTFSFKRFSGYLKMLLAERRRSLLISTIIVTVLLLLIMLVASYTCYSWYFSGPTSPDNVPNSDIYVPGVLFFIVLFGVGCISATRMGYNLGSKGGRINQLKVPVSKLENWLARFVIQMILVVIVALVIDYAIDLLRCLIYGSLPFVKPLDIEETLGLFFGTKSVPVWAYYLFFTSLFGLGGLLFVRKPLIGTLLALIIVYVVFMFGLADVAWFFERLQKGQIVTAIYLSLSAIFCWWLSYRRFSELDVVTPYFRGRKLTASVLAIIFLVVSYFFFLFTNLFMNQGLFQEQGIVKPHYVTETIKPVQEIELLQDTTFYSGAIDVNVRQAKPHQGFSIRMDKEMFSYELKDGKLIVRIEDANKLQDALTRVSESNADMAGESDNSVLKANSKTTALQPVSIDITVPEGLKEVKTNRVNDNVYNLNLYDLSTPWLSVKGMQDVYLCAGCHIGHLSTNSDFCWRGGQLQALEFTPPGQNYAFCFTSAVLNQQIDSLIAHYSVTGVKPELFKHILVKATKKTSVSVSCDYEKDTQMK